MAYFGPIRELDEAPLVEPGSKHSDITNDISRVSQTKAPRGWWIAFAISSAFASMFVFSVGYLFYRGIGAWGNPSPVYWAWDITNFVWWVGIGLVSGQADPLARLEERSPVELVSQICSHVAGETRQILYVDFSRGLSPRGALCTSCSP